MGVMMLLFKNAQVYAPEALGRKDVLIAGSRIVAVEDAMGLPEGLDVEVIDAEGMRLIPGLIDAHVHIAGAGGEGGPASRTSELPLSTYLEAGVTTVVGCLGTDGMTRNIESVLMRAKGLRAEGISCWIYTGSYQVPTPTLLGDVGRDVALIDEVIGVGEVALADHRSSCPTVDELIRLTEHARVGGMLGGKAGIVNIHMGDEKNPFRLLYEVVEKSMLKLNQFLPTHCNRNDYIFKDAFEYGKQGFVDLTSSSYPYYPEYEIKPSKAIKLLLSNGVPLAHITMTSDAGGSLPDFDEKGNLVKLDSATSRSQFTELMDAVNQEELPLEKALAVVTSNPADILKLHQKGRIAPGKDGDVVLIDNDDAIKYLAANGQLMIRDHVMIRKGSFE